MCGLKQRALRTSAILTIITLTTALPCLAGIYGIVEGTVTDGRGYPLVGATIRIDGTSQGAVSGVDGRFRIVKVQAGTYDLSVTYVGFVSDKMSSVVIHPDDTTRIAFEMFEWGRQPGKPYLSGRPAPIQFHSWLNDMHPGPIDLRADEDGAPMHRAATGLTGLQFRHSVETPVTRAVPFCEGHGAAILRHLLEHGVENTGVPPRIEELVNTPRYSYAAPTDVDVALYSELTPCPWNPANYLLNIAVCTREPTAAERENSDRVVHLIVDVTGSMHSEGKLEKLKRDIEEYLRRADAATAVGLHVVVDGNVQTVRSPWPRLQRNELRAALSSLNFDQAKQKFSVYDLPKHLAGDGNSTLQKRIVVFSDGADLFKSGKGAELQRMINELKVIDATLDIVSVGTLATDNCHLSDLARRCGGQHRIAVTTGELSAALDEAFIADRVPVLFNPLVDFDFNPHLVESYRMLGCDPRGVAVWYYAPADKSAPSMSGGAQHIFQFEIVPAADRDGALSVYTEPMLTDRALASGELVSVRLSYTPASTAQRETVELAVANSVTALDDASADFKLSAALACLGLHIVNAPNAHGATLRLARELAAGEPRGDKNRIRSMREETVALLYSRVGRSFSRPNLQFNR